MGSKRKRFRILTLADRTRFWKQSGFPGKVPPLPKGKVAVQAPNGSVRYYPRKGAKEYVRKLNEQYESNSSMTSLTYGQLPTKRQFLAAYKRELGDGEYRMRLRGADVDAVRGTVFESGTSFDVDDTWDGLKELRDKWEEGNDAAGDLASSILFTLNFEWI